MPDWPPAGTPAADPGKPDAEGGWDPVAVTPGDPSCLVPRVDAARPLTSEGSDATEKSIGGGQGNLFWPCGRVMAAERNGPVTHEPEGSRWFVAHVKPRQEEAVCQRLRYKGVVTFLPRLLTQRRHGSRRWLAIEPLFPGYVFVRFPLDAGVLYRVRWTPGIRRLLGNEEGPTPIEDGVVAYLKERMGELGYIVPRQELRPGDRVRFRDGPFAMLEGVIDRPASSRDRVRVLLRLCGTLVSVETATAELEPV